MKILFIGGGKMMQAIAGGLLAEADAPQLFAVEPDAINRAFISAMGVYAVADGAEVTNVSEIDVIFLAVKPQVMQSALAPFAGKLEKQLVVSIAAGIRTSEIARWLSHPVIVRAMPNTPALIRAGITGLFAVAAVDAENRARTENLLSTIGNVAWFDDESMLDVVTAVSGSGPAYVFYAIEALEQAATDLGMTAVLARQFALDTFRGASLLAAESVDSPAVLRANVTSKRGTTEAAIDVFDQEQLKARFIAGVTAAAARATALGDALANAKSQPREGDDVDGGKNAR